MGDQNSKKSNILLIIPAYNEAENIARVVDEIRTGFPQYDYVVINDASLDDTRKICAANGYNYLDLPVNVGLSGAIQAGFHYANRYDYDYVVQVDGDGQHMPEYIEEMLRTMQEKNADVVIGSRFKTERKPVTPRMIGSQIITMAVYLTTRGHYIGDVTSGMRLYNKRMIKILGYQINFDPEPETLAFLINCGAKVEEVQVQMRDRIAGESYLGFSASVMYMTRRLFAILLFQWFRKKPTLLMEETI